MRKLMFAVALTVVGAGLAGWATLGSAQPKPELPPIPSPDRFADPAKPPALPEPPIPGVKAPRAEDMLPTKPLPVPSRVSGESPFADTLPTPKAGVPSAPTGRESPVRINTPETKPVKDPIPATSEPIKPLILSGDEKEPAKPLIISGTGTAKPTENRILPTSGGSPSGTTASQNSMSLQPSMAKQEPSVSLEWVGPTALKLGTPAEYSLMVRNTCPIPVQKVIVQVRVPQGATVSGTDPKAEGTEGVLLWDLGTLLSRQEKPLKIKMTPSGKGEMNCQAWVTFTGSAAMKVAVREPKLLVKAQAPEKVLVGDPANVVLTVSNPGDFQAETVKVAVHLADGLESARGNKPIIELGTLAAGETRTVTIPCLAKAAGEQRCEARVEGSDGLNAKDGVSLNIIQPRLDLEVAGPKLRYLDRKATYTLKVTNPGDAPATNVMVTELIPAGFKFVGADNGGQHDSAARTVKWFVGEVPAGQSKEMKMELIAATIGEFSHKVIAAASRGIRSEKDHPTKVEGLSALLMEVVDVDDPIEVGTEAAYEIRITNTGSKFENDMKLVCTIPPQMKFKSAQGPVKYDVVGNEIVFETLPKLAPRADATFKIICTAAVKGDARFKATLTSGGLTEPVLKQESTRVYDD